MARIGGVQGVHWARRATPRRQDAGFGYLVASIADALRAGQPFTVWESDAINTVATPTLATDAAELVHAICRARADGHVPLRRRRGRRPRGLAELTVDVFGLDPRCCASARRRPAPSPTPRPVRHEPRRTQTAAALGATLPSARSMVERLREELP